MQPFRRFAILVLILAAAGAAPALAQNVNVPLTNWTVPAYHRSGPSGGISTMTDITSGVAFVGVQPCRIVDTRGGGVFTGAYGPPIMAANAIRSFDLNSAAHCTGIPAGVDAYSLNFTVTETAGPSGDIRAWPTGNPPAQVTSVLNWTQTNAVVANATIIPAGTNGAIDVQVAGSDTHLLIDINGYFTDSYNSGVPFAASGLITGGMIAGTNASNANGASGVRGVQGVVVASTPNQAPAGVVGTSFLFDGVLGVTQCSGMGACSGGAGVKGARTSGTSATAVLSSGELGVASLGGRFVNDVDIDGDLTVACTTTYGCNLEADGGVKMFVEPHPIDASKVIKYVSLEGPESGTYFRGRARFQNGVARIAVPEDFRFVTSPDGLTVQVTPIGGMATYGVIKLGLDEIVVRGSRNLEFSYLVQGVRKAFPDFHPIQDAGVRYSKAGAGARLPMGMPAELKRRLIANGTYNPDGTVNMETARRLGWERIWSAREHDEAPPATQPNP